EHTDTNQGSPQAYKGSSLTGYTLAALPGVPTGTIAGNQAQGLSVAINISSDTNSPDSLYALQVLPPKGSPYYLNGAGATIDGQGSASAVWLTSAAWN